MNTPHDYAYLWTNPDSGWVLLRINRQDVSLTVRFSDAGPSLRDVWAMRSALPQFNAMPPSEAFAALKGRTEIALGQFESQEGRRLAERCRAYGLFIDTLGLDRSEYLPFNEKTRMSLVIEDDEVAQQVYREALSRGIRVKHVEA